jgi:hypothetical protein
MHRLSFKYIFFAEFLCTKSEEEEGEPSWMSTSVILSLQFSLCNYKGCPEAVPSSFIIAQGVTEETKENKRDYRTYNHRQ